MQTINNRVNVKVVMLGKEFGGKTAMVERFLHNQFNPAAYKNTIAAEYRAKRLEVDGRYVILGVWDTAGSERYQSLSRIYYRGAFEAVVCYDLTDSSSFDKVKFWVTEVTQYQPTCRIYFCGTKQDLLSAVPTGSNLQVTQDSVRKYAEQCVQSPHKVHFYETSSKTGYNVEEMFAEIAREYLEEGGGSDSSDDSWVKGGAIDLIRKPGENVQCKMC